MFDLFAIAKFLLVMWLSPYGTAMMHLSTKFGANNFIKSEILTFTKIHYGSKVVLDCHGKWMWHILS